MVEQILYRKGESKVGRYVSFTDLKKDWIELPLFET